MTPEQQKAVRRVPGLAGSLVIRVDVDPALTEGLSRVLVERLAHGVELRQCKGGVRVGHEGPRGVVCANSEELVDAWRNSASANAEVATAFGDNASGRWYADRAAFFTICADYVERHAARLWPEERV